jgi:mono/diheme cytochrome c family protein
MTVSRFAIAALAAAAVLGMSGLLHAQNAGRSIWSGVYTDAQAARGKAAYTDNCARCHGPALQGNDEIPALQGAQFMVDFDGSTVADLTNRVRTTMPMDNPGHLDNATTTDIVTFLLQSNQVPAGSSELSSEPPVQSLIKFSAAKPDAK